LRITGSVFNVYLGKWSIYTLVGYGVVDLSNPLPGLLKYLWPYYYGSRGLCSEFGGPFQKKKKKVRHTPKNTWAF